MTLSTILVSNHHQFSNKIAQRDEMNFVALVLFLVATNTEITLDSVD